MYDKVTNDTTCQDLLWTILWQYLTSLRPDIMQVESCTQLLLDYYSLQCTVLRRLIIAQIGCEFIVLQSHTAR